MMIIISKHNKSYINIMQPFHNEPIEVLKLHKKIIAE